MQKPVIGVVEDEMVIADTICLNLRKLGYTTTTTSPSYARAIKMMEEEKPDLMLVDINLGGEKDGIDLAKHIRQHYPIPIIFLTANSDAATLERAKQVNPDGYIVKPYKKSDLFAAIEIAMSNRSRQFQKPEAIDYIMVKDGYDYIKVFLMEIVYVQSDQNYAVLNLKNGKKLMVRSTIGEMMEKLPPNVFNRIGRGTIVNTQHINKVQTDKVIIGDAAFTISKATRDGLIALMEGLFK
ncbi:MAG: response regulator [Bacteroidia bacterium]|nr:response regulator [Bacteroidia bacterium]